jgi:diguanylate cyclase (GGDEF)-like protein/PAS domain S-box-containing protein
MHIRQSYSYTSLARVSGLIGLVLFMSIYTLAPAAFGLTEEQRLRCMMAIQGGGLAIAIMLSHQASKHGVMNTRKAWRSFAIGLWLYLVGNLFVIYRYLSGEELHFPASTEFVYFLMAIAFAIGISHYGEMQSRLGKTTLYSFILVYCAIAVGCLLLLKEDIASSTLDDLPTLVAFMYPALWFSVFAFGVMSFCVYNQDRRTFTYILILVAVFAEAVADMIYAKELINGEYALGGVTEFLWVLSIYTLIWALVERLRTQHRIATRPPVEAGYENKGALAALPPAAVFLFMSAAAYSGAFGQNPINVGFGLLLGTVFAVVLFMREFSILSILYRLRNAAAEGERKLSEVLESTSDSVVVLDSNWRITYFNKRAENILNDVDELFIGRRLWDDRSREDFPKREMLEEALSKQIAVEFEAPFGNHGTWLGVHAFPSHEGLSIFFRDISERRRARIEIEHLALNDALTELGNRFAFQKRLAHHLENGDHISLLILDLDHFKEVNDTKGHPFGDAVLKIVAKRLSNCMTDSFIARVGGDEFAVIIPGSDEQVAMHAAERIMLSLRRAISVEDEVVRIGVSIGIALTTGAVDPEVLFRNADIALYNAKTNGRKSFAFFEEAMERLLRERNTMKSDLAIALEQDQFELHFQPLVDFRTGKVKSFEALLRWRHPTRGLQPPDTFISLIEETGLIVPIGAWVLRAACKTLASLPSDISIAVNVSPKQLLDQDLTHAIKSALEDYSLPPERLDIEITESALLDEHGDNLKVLQDIKALGIKIALDDFGTGYSALSYLHKFSFDKLKIDKSFVQALDTEQQSNSIVQSIIGLAHSLQMEITAEGIETQAQYDWLKPNCSYAQGHLISKPLPATEAISFLDTFHGP